MNRYVIVGCGAAGNAAAETIRKVDPESEIRMFTKEANYYYYRPALPEYLAGEKNAQGFHAARCSLVRKKPDRSSPLD